jgi:hypothetical protein
MTTKECDPRRVVTFPVEAPRLRGSHWTTEPERGACREGVGKWKAVSHSESLTAAQRDGATWILLQTATSRHLQNPKGLDIFQATACHCPAPLYERGMHAHLTAVPRMPRIADGSTLTNMGVVLMSCLSRSAITRA